MEMLFLLLIFSAETLGLDPCDNYTVLDNAWRATSNRVSSTVMCDRNVQWVGWYRLFLNDRSAQMSDTCVKENICGTHATLWLNGQHPRMEDGAVTRDVCGSWNNNCCYFKSTPINVKACPGQYYIYELKSPIGCHFAYCAVIDECGIMCGPNAFCHNNNGSISCSCLGGYIATNMNEMISRNNPCTDVDECQASPSVCGPNAYCTNVKGGYNCSCSEGFSATFPDLIISINNICMA
ncbi:pancreatic secretory granule membrane major glycoprotein GP2-like [Triplophysa rosa]|nr:pancreatic secretory granule membrane major glycoprotein GP2-like [Triplophysa rosa]